MMKRIMTLTLAVLMLLSMASCGKKEAEPTVATTEPPVETTEATIPAPTEPEWEPGIARAAYGEVLYATLEKGAEVNILGQFKDYYVIEGEEADLLIEQRFARLDTEDPYEEWTGYAKKNTEVFDNVYGNGEAIASLNGSQKVQVIEGKGDWLYIRWDDQEGYADASKISKNRGGGGGSGSSGGGGGGAVDGTGFDFGSLSAAGETWKATLLGAYFGPEMEKAEAETETEEEAFVPGMGKVIAHDIEAYITLTLRDDEVKVTEQTEETVIIWLADEFYGTLPRWLIQMEGDEAYETWEGYVKRNAVVYEEYQMRNELESPKTNTKVTVLDELPDCYVVELEDGRIGYMELDGVSETKVSSGGGGSGSSGGGGAVWTPPAL